MNGGQEHEPKLRIKGRPVLAIERRGLRALVSRFTICGLGANAPNLAGFKISWMEDSIIHFIMSNENKNWTSSAP